MPHLSQFLCFWFLSLLCKMASKHRGELLSSIPKTKEAVMWLREKIPVLDKRSCLG